MSSPVFVLEAPRILAEIDARNYNRRKFPFRRKHRFVFHEDIFIEFDHCQRRVIGGFSIRRTLYRLAELYFVAVIPEGCIVEDDGERLQLLKFVPETTDTVIAFLEGLMKGHSQMLRVDHACGNESC